MTVALAREVATRVATLDGVVAVAVGGLSSDPAALRALLGRMAALTAAVRPR